MLLTSYERARRFLCVDDTATNRRVVNQFIYAISAQIEAYLDRQFEKISRTEFYNLSQGDREFWVRAVPVEIITTVKVDPTGEFEGSQTTLTDSYIGRSGNSIVLQFAQIPAKRGLELVYTGGLATVTSISTFTLSSVIGTFTVGGFLEGITSGSFGIIKSFNTVSKVMTVDVLYGAFAQGDSLNFRPDEEGGLATGISAVLSTIDVRSLVEVIPEIATACETQIRYNVKTKDDFENKTVDKDMVSRRASQQELTFRGAYQDLQPETRSLINKFRRYVLQ